MSCLHLAIATFIRDTLFCSRDNALC